MKAYDYGELLDFADWGLGIILRPTLGNLLGGHDQLSEVIRRDRFIRQLQQKRMLRMVGRGQAARFEILPAAIPPRRPFDPTTSWDKPWDGQWRIVTFDLPETRRKDRKRLWRALRARQVGLLQRSVWVWPQPMEEMLREIIDAEGIPECFCGFAASQIFLCTNTEIVDAAWDFVEIGRRHAAYESQARGALHAVGAAADLASLVRLARSERQLYANAFVWDPLLPRVLWPPSYRGEVVHRHHLAFRARLAARARELVHSLEAR